MTMCENALETATDAINLAREQSLKPDNKNETVRVRVPCTKFNCPMYFIARAKNGKDVGEVTHEGTCSYTGSEPYIPD